MKLSNIILAGCTATTAFTLFSYMVSGATDHNYKEPQLIGDMIDRTTNDLDKKQSRFTGWLIHYLIGVGFAAAYRQLIEKTGMRPDFRNGAVAGALSGFPAILAWNATLDIHPAPPRTKSWDYYAQLFFGHIIFGAVCFHILGRSRKSKSSEGTIHPGGSGSYQTH